MCGIVGYIGKEQAAPILIEGLSRLEYRGYDSAGVAVFDAESGSLAVHKAKGRLQVLSEQLHGGADLDSTVGVGHTRHPRRTQRHQFPSPDEPQRQDCRGSQRDH